MALTQTEENEIASTVIEPDVADALAAVKAAAHARYEIDDDNFIDYVLALAIANKFRDEPLWGFLVGPPSSLKTQMLLTLRSCPWVYFMSTLTPHAFSSGWVDKKGAKSSSLLPKLNGKVMVIKDFTPILQMRSEHRSEIIGSLRDIHDGSHLKVFGIGDPEPWEGKVGAIAAVTPEIERVTSVNQNLGERFLYYRMCMTNSDNVAQKAFDNTMEDDDDRRSSGLRDSVTRFLKLFNSAYLKKGKYASSSMRRKVVSLSDFCAMCRTSVGRDYRDRDHVEIPPESEGTGRITKQLTMLGIALATIRGQNGIDAGVFGVLSKVVRDMIPSRRLKILRELVASRLDNPDQFYGIEVMGLKAGVNSHTCRLDLDDLFLLKLANKKFDSSRIKQLYQASDKLLIAAVESEIFGE